jgi:hypothetical protein
MSSQQTSFSAWSQTPGTPKFVTWRDAGPAPRTSTGTSVAGPYLAGSRFSHIADGSATSAPRALIIRIRLSRPT